MKKYKRTIDEKYCGRCGSPLIFTYSFASYNTTSGKKEFRLIATCPNAEKGILGKIQREFSFTYPQHTKDDFIGFDDEDELAKGVIIL